MRILLINPPLADPEGPYPAIAYLAGYLRTIDREAVLADVSLQLIRRLLSKTGLTELCEDLRHREVLAPSAQAFLSTSVRYLEVIDTVVKAVQGTDAGAVARVLQRDYLPRPLDEARFRAQQHALASMTLAGRIGPLTDSQRRRLWDPDVALTVKFGDLGEVEKARYLGSCVISDIVRVVRDSIDPSFELHRYAESIATDSDTFDLLQQRLDSSPTLIDKWIDEFSDDAWRAHQPDVVGLSVPFPGNVLGALRIAMRMKRLAPGLPIVMGGGWVNTTLRQLAEPRLFDYVDFVTLDAGERPLWCLLEHLEGRRPVEQLCRTYVRAGSEVRWVNGADEPDVPFSETGFPTYGNLPLKDYVRHRPFLSASSYAWRNRWNKLTLAHGCYWKKCAFCDVRLDYISRYDPGRLEVTLARIRSLLAETGETGFHFVDEAIPPALLARLSQRLLAEGLQITWWGNVRFDEALSTMAPLLARAGCVRLTGGLEVASDRLLDLMAKGVSLAQVAKVTAALAAAGIDVHAYLIYGFPTQTDQETIDALEYVRQLMRRGLVRSVFWHRFSLTAHSPIAESPERFGVRIVERPPSRFATYGLPYVEPGGADHDRFRSGLNRAAEAYMLGLWLDRPVVEWFDFQVPAPTLAPDFVERYARLAETLT